MKNLFVTFLICCIFVTNVYADESYPVVAAKGAVLMDMDSGRVLWGKNENEPMTMASTTKIMTAILVLENGNMDDVVTVSKRAASAPEVNMNLRTGETHRLEDLLYAMMLKSYNDAAVAAAEHVGGSVEKFCQMMTDKAKEIGAKNTVFASPNGLDSNLDFSQHHSTAYDMALITRYALKNPAFVKIITTKEVTIPLKGGNDKSYYIPNADRFLTMYEGAFGVKTGFTNKAGQCFVGAAKKGDRILISVVLASGWGTAGKEQKWKDTKKIMDYGFENFEMGTVAEKGTQIEQSIFINGSKTKEIQAEFEEGMHMLLNKNVKETIETRIQLPTELNAPVKKGQKIGEAEIFIDGEYIGNIALISTGEAQSYDLKKTIKGLMDNWANTNIETIKNLI